jgi:choice-of-anchor C domain-containing protein
LGRSIGLAALSFAAWLLLAGGAYGSPAGDLVTNGSFELPPVSAAHATTFDTYGPGSNLDGWTVTGNSIDLIEGYWQPYDGAQSIDLDGNGPGGVSQVLSTTSGQAYTLTFAYSRNKDHCVPDPSMTVTWAGAAIGTYSDSDNTTAANMMWRTASVLIPATSTTSSSTTLAFTSDDPSGACGLALDDVSVTPAGFFPTISTSPTASATVGDTIADSATLAGAASGAVGTITFNAYVDSSCATNAAYTFTATVSGNGIYTAPGFQATLAGSYYWTAAYSGDPATNTAAASQGCAAGETTTVNPTNDAWTRAQLITLDGNGNGSASDSIDFSGEPRWYKFEVTPGATVQVNLSSLPGNYDLSLFGDIGQEESKLASSPPDLQELAAETPGVAASPYAISPYAISPYAISPYAISPFAISPWAISPFAISPYAISPFAISPYAISPYAISPYAISPWAVSPYAISGLDAPDVSAADYDEAQLLSLLGVSQNPGTGGQQVFENVWNPEADQVSSSGPTYFYILVDGNNGAYAPGSKFQVSVQEDQGACGNVQPSPDSLLSTSYSGPANTASTFKTLILTDESRLSAYGNTTAMESDLQTFANEPSVDGTILDVGTSSPQVTDLQSQADAEDNVGCPYAKNLVASSIRQIVNGVRANDPDLKYIVIVGNDHVIPFFRYSDTAPAESTESGFNPPVLPSSSSFAALQDNEFLSQDAYGSTKVLEINGQELPVPDLPVGRLVNSPSEIDGLLQAYIGLSGGVVATPSSSLVTGYDFMTKTADAVEDDLCAGLGTCATAGPGNASNTTLITDDGVPPSQTGAPPTNSWTASQLTTALTGSRHDLIFLGGHFSASAALAADYSTTMSASQLTSSNVNLENSIVFSAGCHSGYNIVPDDTVPDVTQTPDWAEAFAQKQATLIAGTGYQYGDTDFLAYSDQVYADFSHELLQGSGAVPVGSALVAAERDYLDGVGGSYPNQSGTGVPSSDATIPTNAVNSSNLQGIDIKSLLEVTLYGLPMLSVDLPDGREESQSGGSSIVSTPTSAPDDTPGQALGLSWFDVTRNPTFTTQTTQLNTSTGGLLPATYLQGPSGITTSPGAPALPLDTANVTYDDQVLRGVGFRSGVYTDTNGVTPLTGAPATDLNGTHYTFGSSVFYPDRLATVNYLDGLADGSNSTELDVTPAQYESDAPGSSTDTQRAYSSVGLRLFYNGNTATYGANTPALAAPPAISRVDATVSGSSVKFSAHVAGDPLVGIQQVWVTYTGVDVPSSPAGATGEWESLDLSEDQADPTLWTGTLSNLMPTQIANLQFMVQAVNGVGLVTLDDNQGSYYQPDEIPPALQSAASAVTATSLRLGASNPASGGYGSSVSVSATLTGPGPLSGQAVAFTIGSSTVDASTNASGTASASVPLTNNPGSQYQLSASYAGNATYASSSASPTSFTIQKLPTVLSLGGNSGATVLYGGNGSIAATLTSGATGLASYPVAFVFTPTNGTPGSQSVRQSTTGGSGAASLGIGTQLVPGTYSVQAFFGPPGPNLSSDPVFMASSTTSPFTLTVSQAPTITSANKTTFTTGSAGSFTVSTTGAPTSTITNASFGGCTKSAALPANVTLVDNHNGTATLAGTPAGGTGGTYTLCINAANGVAPAATQTFTLTVDQAPAITSAAAATFTTGSAGSFTVKTTGFPTSTITNASFGGCSKSAALPSNLKLVDNHDGTATLSGTPAAGTNAVYTLCLNAANGIGSTATQTFTLTVTTLLGSGTTACNGVYSGSGSQMTVASGAVCTLLPGTKLSGNLQVNQGGELNDQGAAISGNLTATNAAWVEIGGGGSVGGNLQIQGLTGAPAGSHNSLCNTTVSGNVLVQSSGAHSPVDIGNVGACAGGAVLTVGGNLQVSSNSAAVTVGGNTVKGAIQVQSNTGGGTLTGNSAGGNCALQGDSPAIAGSANSAHGTNTCNRNA